MERVILTASIINMLNEFLISAGAGFIITIAGIALLSNFFFPLFLKHNDKMNEHFKDETPSE